MKPERKYTFPTSSWPARFAAIPTSCSGQASTRFAVTPSGAWKRWQVTVQCCYKWLPPIQHIDPANQRLVPFYLRLKELGLPLLSHTGSEHSFTRARNELGDPERLRLPLSLGVTVIAAHAAGSGRNQGKPIPTVFSACANIPISMSISRP